jgi:hypothetical protein
MCNVIADHVREITEKNAEIAELRYSLAQAQGVAQACEARAERAEASNAALRKAIKLAPHSAGCAFLYCHTAMPLGGICATGPEFHSTPPQRGGVFHPFVPGECSCWKRAAPKGEP